MRIFATVLLFNSRPPSPPLRNGSELFAIAVSLASGRGFSSPFFVPSGPTAFLAPGYPILLAAVFRLFGIGVAAVVAIVVVQILFSVLTVWLVIRLSRRHFGVAVANAAGLICAFSLPLAIAPFVVWETCLSSLLLLAFFAGIPHLRTATHWAAAGAVTALAGLVNPALLPSFFALGFLQARRARRTCWIGLLAFLVLYAPWPIRNYAVMHALIPLRSNFGYELWMGNHPGGDGDFRQELNPLVNPAERARFVSMGELPFMRDKAAQATQTIRTQPRLFLFWTLRRMGRFWTAATHGMVVTGAIFSLLGFAGLIAVWRKRPELRAYAIPLILYPLPYYITHPDARFRYAIDPFLAILCAYALTVFYGHLKALRARRSAKLQPA